MSDLEWSYPELEKKVKNFMAISDPHYHGRAIEIMQELLQALKNERADILMYTEIASKVYDHVTGGMISKPNTDASVIIDVHDDYVGQLIDDEIEAAIDDARDLWETELKTTDGDD